jgi:predicted nucleic acid-binding protein
MAGRIVLIDASPVIGLVRVDGLPWLGALFGSVWMPPEVRSEVLTDAVFAEEAAIRDAELRGCLRTSAQAPTLPILPDLDAGEASCIRLALAHDGPALLLMDERAGRAIAQEHGLVVAGTAAIIGMAKARQLIPSARTVFERLHSSDFRISAQVIETVLRRVGELV